MAKDKIQGFNINSEGYGTIPKSVMQSKEISVAAKAVYAYFCSYTGAGNTCFPSRNKICFDLDITKDSVTKYVKELTDAGYLTVEQEREKGRFSRNVYTLPDIKIPSTKTTDTVKTGHDNLAPINNTIKNNSSFISNSSKKERRKSGYDDKGRFSGYDYDIFEQAQEKQGVENQPLEIQSVENPPQLNTNSLTTKEVSTNELNKKKERRKSGYDEILSTVSDASLRELYLEYIKMRKLIKAPMTDRALQMLINKVNELEPYSEDRQKQMLETAIVNNWKSVYPLKDGGRTQKPEKQSTYNSFMDELAEFIEESGKNGNSPENR